MTTPTLSNWVACPVTGTEVEGVKDIVELVTLIRQETVDRGPVPFSNNFAHGPELSVESNNNALNEELVVSLKEESLDGPIGSIRGAGKPQQEEEPSSNGGIKDFVASNFEPYALSIKREPHSTYAYLTITDPCRTDLVQRTSVWSLKANFIVFTVLGFALKDSKNCEHH